MNILNLFTELKFHVAQGIKVSKFRRFIFNMNSSHPINFFLFKPKNTLEKDFFMDFSDKYLNKYIFISI